MAGSAKMILIAAAISVLPHAFAAASTLDSLELSDSEISRRCEARPPACVRDHQKVREIVARYRAQEKASVGKIEASPATCLGNPNQTNCQKSLAEMYRSGLAGHRELAKLAARSEEELSGILAGGVDGKLKSEVEALRAEMAARREMHAAGRKDSDQKALESPTKGVYHYGSDVSMLVRRDPNLPEGLGSGTAQPGANSDISGRSDTLGAGEGEQGGSARTGGSESTASSGNKAGGKASDDTGRPNSMGNDGDSAALSDSAADKADAKAKASSDAKKARKEDSQPQTVRSDASTLARQRCQKLKDAFYFHNPPPHGCNNTKKFYKALFQLHGYVYAYCQSNSMPPESAKCKDPNFLQDWDAFTGRYAALENASLQAHEAAAGDEYRQCQLVAKRLLTYLTENREEVALWKSPLRDCRK